MDTEKETLIEAYLEKLLEANRITNVTRIDSLEEGRVLHIEDSLVGLPEIEEAPDGLYGDLGSGGGFPGVPIAIATGRETVLVDSVKKKMHTVEAILRQLNLGGQIATYGGRIEELSVERPEAFSVLTARALTRLNSLLELASPLLCNGGHLVCYKALLPDDELEEAKAMCDRVGMAFVSQRKVLLSDNQTHRTIIVFEKTKSPDISLPRRNGMAQKRPLKPQV